MIVDDFASQSLIEWDLLHLSVLANPSLEHFTINIQCVGSLNVLIYHFHLSRSISNGEHREFHADGFVIIKLRDMPGAFLSQEGSCSSPALI